MAPIKVKKPQAILFDLSGTATKSYFLDKILFPYIRMNCATYLDNNWENAVLQKDIAKMREQSTKDGGPEIAPADQDADTIKKSVCEYVYKCLDEVRQSDPITVFRLHMWFDGYTREKLETPVYSDVAIQIKHWRVDQNIKLYVFSNGWKEATKRFMSHTNHGDLNLLIDGHFDNSDGPLNEKDTFLKVLDRIKLPGSEVLFLTKSGEEGRAAKCAGLNVVLVLTHRRNIATLDEDDKSLLFIRSFNELNFTGDASEEPPPSSDQAAGNKSASSAATSSKGSSTSNMSASSSAMTSKGSSSKGSSSASSLSKGSSSATSSKGSSSATSSKGSSSATSSKGSSSATSSKGSSSATSSKGTSSATSSKGSSSATSSSKGSSSALSSSKTSNSRGSNASSSKGSMSSSKASSSKGSSSNVSSSKGSSSNVSSSKGSSSRTSSSKTSSSKSKSSSSHL